MTRRFTILLLIMLTVSCSSRQEGYVITGETVGLEQGMARLRVFQGEEYVYIDSATIEDGKFVMEGSVDFPAYAYLDLLGMRTPVGFFMDNDSIQIIVNTSHPELSIVKGSEPNDQLKNLFEEIDAELEDLMERYRTASEAGDSDMLGELTSQYNDLSAKRQEIISDYIDNNKSSVITPYLVRSNNIYSMGWEELDSLVSTFDPALEASPYTRFFRSRIETLKNVDIGQPAPDFTQPDTSGNPLSLSSLIGRSELLLIDFWASWCGPCRQENPNIVAVYEDYHDKGLEILGVSLDRPGDAERWKQAIRDDKLNWYHMSDLQYWDNAAARLYGVMAIPHSVLLGGDGIIIAKNLRGEALRQKVAEILD
ncbi:MAG TPA: AhpC/TSA family protein [Bacteroidetes bacterium]|nr:AhpC/TSA family protein [Bacteroidota bacterium]